MLATPRHATLELELEPLELEPHTGLKLELLVMEMALTSEQLEVKMGQKLDLLEMGLKLKLLEIEMGLELWTLKKRKV